MRNNKAQALVIFVIVLPVLLIFLAYVFDTINVGYEKRKMKNIASINSVEKENICSFVKKNDKNIICSIDNDIVKLEKNIKSLFGKIIGKEYYNIKISIKL